jgi:hypothetical protein
METLWEQMEHEIVPQQSSPSSSAQQITAPPMAAIIHKAMSAVKSRCMAAL